MPKNPKTGANVGDQHPENESTAPVAPAAETAPVAPAAETAPVTPVAQTQPIAPVTQTQPIAPLAQTQPIAPVAQTQPIAPLAQTQPIPPVHATQPLPAAPAAHPTNPFTPPHPAAPADQRALYEATQVVAAATAAAHAEAVRRAQWDAAQRASIQDPALVQQHVREQQVEQPAVFQAAYQAPQEATAGQQYLPQGPAPVVPTQRKRRSWIPITSAAAAAAIVAAVATGGVVHSLSGDDVADALRRPASLATIGQDTNDTVPVSGSTSDSPDWEAVSKAVQASVVAIQVTIGGGGGGAEGSGVIVDDAGHIVTNNHVVGDADKDSIEVTLNDGRIFKATVVGTDPTTDLAVIKLTDPPKDLKPAEFGDSSKVVVGQAVMAVGNPLGLASTVTTGIVSAVDRPVSTSGENGGDATVTNAIQVDAAVNPGNSGGPLFDAAGRVIGINSSIATLSQESGSIGLGFAIPVDLVKNVAAQLVEDGTAEHAFLGVTLSDGTATADDVTRRGAVVQSVSDSSPASKAGIKTDDTIVAIDGKAVAGAESLTAYVRALPSDTKVTLTVVRDGKASEMDVTLAVRPEPAASSNGSDDNSGDNSGDSNDEGQQAPDQQAPDLGSPGDGSDKGGANGLPNGMTPEQLWEWFQSQQQGNG
ncbi:S1C family serine protease [Cellulomonas sp. URHE0023]|uniref:S1C family serine protease n=1 Tax=Cellulomonas sp. URHE0023 TaxID=1380354 RepID=UPI0006909E2E|nr:trypsin-like peptidase domain-containing protein [Cellulomonas sp. URHE0023]